MGAGSGYVARLRRNASRILLMLLLENDLQPKHARLFVSPISRSTKELPCGAQERSSTSASESSPSHSFQLGAAMGHAQSVGGTVGEIFTYSPSHVMCAVDP